MAQAPTGLTSQSFILAKHGVFSELLMQPQMESEGSWGQKYCMFLTQGVVWSADNINIEGL